MHRTMYTIALSAMALGACATMSEDKDGAVDEASVDTSALVVEDDTAVALDPAPNTAPQAAAGADQLAEVGDTITLDGSGSSDPDGHMLAFRWSFVQRPAESNTSITNAAEEMASFYVDAPGTYEVELVVSDGAVEDSDVTVILTESDTLAPTANAGPDQVADVGDSVELDGSASEDPEGTTLHYDWELISRPAGSFASLTGTSLQPATNPSLVPDRVGTYTVQLVVEDEDGVRSPPDTVRVTARDASSDGGGGDGGGCGSGCNGMRLGLGDGLAPPGTRASGFGWLVLPWLGVLAWRRRR